MMSKENTMRSMQLLMGQEVEKAAEQNRQLSYACMEVIGAKRADFENEFAVLKNQDPEFLAQRLGQLEEQMKDMSEPDKAQADAEMKDIKGRIQYIKENEAEYRKGLNAVNVRLAMAAVALFRDVHQVREPKAMLERLGIVAHGEDTIVIGGRRCNIVEGEMDTVITLDGKEIFKGDIPSQGRRQHGYVKITKEIGRQQAGFAQQFYSQGSYPAAYAGVYPQGYEAHSPYRRGLIPPSQKDLESFLPFFYQHQGANMDSAVRDHVPATGELRMLAPETAALVTKSRDKPVVDVVMEKKEEVISTTNQ